MRKQQLVLIAAATLTAGVSVIALKPVWGDDPSRGDSGGQSSGMRDAGARSGAADLPQGITRSQQHDSEGIRQTLGNCTESIITSGDLGTFVQYCAQADRARLTQGADPQQDRQLQDKINQFKQAWRQKYNQDFDIKPEVVFNEQQFEGFEIVQGEVTNPTLLSNWPVQSRGGVEGGGQEQRQDMRDEQRMREQRSDMPGREDVGGPGDPGLREDADRQMGNRGESGQMGDSGRAGEMGDRAAAGGISLDRGMNVAIVSFPEQQGAPELIVSLVREERAQGADRQQQQQGMGGGVQASNWRIDVPDNLTANQLRQNLSTHLDQIMAMQNQWPADANEAYRVVSQHLLTACYTTDSQQQDQQQRQQ